MYQRPAYDTPSRQTRLDNEGCFPVLYPPQCPIAFLRWELGEPKVWPKKFRLATQIADFLVFLENYISYSVYMSLVIFILVFLYQMDSLRVNLIIKGKGFVIHKSTATPIVFAIMKIAQIMKFSMKSHFFIHFYYSNIILKTILFHVHCSLGVYNM